MACSSILLLILFGLKGYFQFEMIMNKDTINIPVLDLAFTSMGSTDAPKLNKISGFGPYFQTVSLKRQLILKSQFLVITSTEGLSETCSFVLSQHLAFAEKRLLAQCRVLVTQEWRPKAAAGMPRAARASPGHRRSCRDGVTMPSAETRTFPRRLPGTGRKKTTLPGRTEKPRGTNWCDPRLLRTRRGEQARGQAGPSGP